MENLCNIVVELENEKDEHCVEVFGQQRSYVTRLFLLLLSNLFVLLRKFCYPSRTCPWTHHRLFESIGFI